MQSHISYKIEFLKLLEMYRAWEWQLLAVRYCWSHCFLFCLREVRRSQWNALLFRKDLYLPWSVLFEIHGMQTKRPKNTVECLTSGRRMKSVARIMDVTQMQRGSENFETEHKASMKMLLRRDSLIWVDLEVKAYSCQKVWSANGWSMFTGRRVCWKWWGSSNLSAWSALPEITALGR